MDDHQDEEGKKAICSNLSRSWNAVADEPNDDRDEAQHVGGKGYGDHKKFKLRKPNCAAVDDSEHQGGREDASERRFVVVFGVATLGHRFVIEHDDIRSRLEGKHNSAGEKAIDNGKQRQNAKMDDVVNGSFHGTTNDGFNEQPFWCQDESGCPKQLTYDQNEEGTWRDSVSDHFDIDNTYLLLI